MSDYLVLPPLEGWGGWKEVVNRSGVRFSKEDLALGEILIERSENPEPRSYVVFSHDYCATSSVGELLQRPYFGDLVPVHPFVLLALAAGIQGAEDDPDIFHHMQYPMAMSPFLLTDPMGCNFILQLVNDRIRYRGEFRSLRDSEHLPRCNHVWSYPTERKLAPPHVCMFRPRADGKYGPFYS